MLAYMDHFGLIPLLVFQDGSEVFGILKRKQVFDFIGSAENLGACM